VDSLWQFQIDLYCTLVRSAPPSLLFDSLHAPLQAIARGFFVLFHIDIWSPSTIFPYLISFVHPPLPTSTFHTRSILQSYLLFLISKSMFKGFFGCMLAVSILYFGPFNPFHSFPCPFPLNPPIFNSCQYLSLYPPPYRCYVLWYGWCSIIVFFFASFPEFHRLVPFLQTCSTSMSLCMIMLVFGCKFVI
jgi:hypothetical protein